MNDSITKAIRNAFPNATIVKLKKVDAQRSDVDADGRTPSVDAMLRKYGQFHYGLMRSGAGADATSGAKQNGSDLVATEIDLNDASLPPSLRRRTVIVDKKKGRVVASEG